MRDRSRCAVLFLVLFALPATVLSCGWIGPYEVYEVTFFSPEVIADPRCTPFFATPFHRFYGIDPESNLVDLSEVNLDEWDAFWHGKLPRKAWAELLYSAPLDRLDNLIFRLKGRPHATNVAEDEPFVAFPDRDLLIAALFYVGFAKRVEPYATERADYWEWEQKKETIDKGARASAVATLAEAGRRAFDAAKDSFLRQRYAFQLLRLYFYHEEYDRSVQFFEARRASEFADGSSIAWRALGYSAGAHYKAGRYAQANYIYSIIFDRYPPLRLSAAWSFRPQEESDWRATLALATSSREKAVLWQLLGIGADGLRAMREIYAIDPASDLLPLLLVREVSHAELAANDTGQLDDSATTPVDRAELVAFVAAVAEKGNAHKPWAWDLAAGHLHAMAGEIAAARTCLARAEKRAPTNQAVAGQARVSRLYATLNAMRHADPAAEPTLATELEWLRREAVVVQGIAQATEGERTPAQERAAAFLSWAKGRLAGLYRERGDLITALCLQDAPQDPFYADSAKVEQLIRFLAKPGKSAFEAFAAGEYRADRDELVEVQGLNALYAGDVETASTLLGQVGGDTLLADPFEIHIRDNHDRDATAPGHATYTKAQLAARLASLLREASANPERAPLLYLDVANAFYNITYFGNCRTMYQTAGGHFVTSPSVDDCGRAESYYRKAHDLATNRELKAKAAFMAAKCEQNAYYARDPDKSKGDFVSATWYEKFRDGFSDTLYYREVIRECGYFRQFVEKTGAGEARKKR
jgi:hypothetical protein